MKRHIIIGSLLSLGTLLLASCSKYLEVNPDNRAEINNIDKVAGLLVSAYPDRHYLFTESASDNSEDRTAALSGTQGQPYEDLYFWRDPEGSGNSTPAEYWNACYRAIAAANHALEAIEQNNFGNKVLPYKGEALIARAYAHHMLVTLFAQAYEIGGANAGMGVPYVTAPETVVFKEYDRGTVQGVYEQIEKDLTEGLELLKGGDWKVPKYHFNQQAAHAFAARFYLFKGDWDKVIEHVSAILPENNFYDNMRQYAGNLSGLTATEHRQEYTKAERPFNLLLANTYSVYHRSSGAGANRYGFGEQVKTHYAGTTAFGATFRTVLFHWTAPNYNPGKYNEYFHYTNVAQGTGLPYIMMPLFTVDEALMNRAEAYIRKESFTYAINDMNEFARARISNFSLTNHGMTLEKARKFSGEADDKKALLNVLLDSKKRAFILEGIRWMDILRHQLTVKHNHIDNNGTETFTELKHGDNRRMFQLPQEVKLSGLPSNPR
ncbi:RagB/SusD family nutrient uptake outer membrane protein [Chitinophaga sp.]|uniref:RagB/SusD family nutrient uptake outer membrane protein n=1 Tax=Chitinophaga sp. TaxID=1869181 RepID=UPI0031D85A79